MTKDQALRTKVGPGIKFQNMRKSPRRQMLDNIEFPLMKTTANSQNRFGKFIPGPSLVLSAWSLVILTACSVGPNYHPPQTALNPAFGNIGAGQYSSNNPSTLWWASF